MRKTVLILFLFVYFSSFLSGQKQNKVYMVSNTHLDTQWLWTVQTTIDDYIYKTMTQNFWLIDHYPDYIFNFEGAVRYNWMKEYYPVEYEKLKKYVEAGRWNLTGSTWDATDTNMPSPESFFRNILYGQEFFKQEFGKKSNDIFLPDCFGFGYTLPTIAAHSGLIGFSTQKLQWRKFPFYGEDKLPFLIGLWEGIDGSKIMAVPHAQDYVSKWENEDLSYNEKILKLAKEDPNHVVYHYYGVGDRGGSPTIPSVASVEKGVKSDGPVEIISARSGQIYDDFYPFEKHPELPVFKGELLMDVHATGCYTSQAAMKLFNRRNEQLADAAERASVVAEELGGIKYPAEELREAWKRFLWHQFHDDMTGTSIPAVYTFSWNDELISQTQFAEATTTAVGAVSRVLDTQVKGIPVVVYNPVAKARKDMVEARIELNNEIKDIVVVTPKGEEIPGQIIDREGNWATVIFAAEMEPVSFSVFEIKAKEGNFSAINNLQISNQFIENKVYKVGLDRNGDIASIIDKRNNKELVKSNQAFRLALFPENVSLAWPAWELFLETLKSDPISITRNVKISIEESGPVRATLKVERTFRESTFIQYITLNNGGEEDRIDVLNEIDWNEPNALLKAEFPMNVANEKARYDLGIGYIERGNNTQTAYEVYAQQWADITNPDESYGISILNDCKYGWDKPNDHTLRLTFLHTPKVGNDPNMTHQDHLDMGYHRIRYSIVGHAGNTSKAETAWKAECMNQSLLSFIAPKHKGEYGRNFSFANTNSPQIAIKAIKKAEDNSGYIIRVNEMTGKDFSNASIQLAFPIESVEEVNGIEEFIQQADFENNTIQFEAKAFQPRTFKVKLKSQKTALDLPVNKFVDLKLNATAVTTDAFSRSGNFDGKGNSFAAELMPEIVTSGDIQFQMNNKPDAYNYMRCEGQEIILPKIGKDEKLYLLIASSDGDRKVAFQVNGKEQEIEIPYYSGFYGQWGWKGESEGYIKNASIAYLGTHRHRQSIGNESYIYTYLYKIEVKPQAGETLQSLVLPNDKKIAVFAATVSDCSNDIVSAMEMRALPLRIESQKSQEKIEKNYDLN